MKNLSQFGLVALMVLAFNNLAAHADNFDSLDTPATSAGSNSVDTADMNPELGDNLNLDTLNIDGQFTDKQPSAAELLKKKRNKLERDNELLARKQIEKMRYQQEMEMAKKLQKVFDDSLKKIEAIN